MIRSFDTSINRSIKKSKHSYLVQKCYAHLIVWLVDWLSCWCWLIGYESAQHTSGSIEFRTYQTIPHNFFRLEIHRYPDIERIVISYPLTRWCAECNGYIGQCVDPTCQPFRISSTVMMHLPHSFVSSIVLWHIDSLISIGFHGGVGILFCCSDLNSGYTLHMHLHYPSFIAFDVSFCQSSPHLKHASLSLKPNFLAIVCSDHWRRHSCVG